MSRETRGYRWYVTLMVFWDENGLWSNGSAQFYYVCVYMCEFFYLVKIFII